ncbi:MAG: hypothetical protein QOG21_691, partial [Actinomycetota bacterium]|nr:hypothetical protein [Actinomycetota bacterium]
VRLVGGVVAEWSRPNGVHYEPALPSAMVWSDGLRTIGSRTKPFTAPPPRAGPISQRAR